MHRYNQDFLRRHRSSLEFYTQRWVADPLHTWSRPWEYLYAYEQINAFISQTPSDSFHLLDAGSGLTYFPFFTSARHPNLTIVCCDYDTQLIQDAQPIASAENGRVQYQQQDLKTLTYSPASFDLIYCISVIEHCGHPGPILEGFSRLLKDRGRLILTIDISLDGRVEIPVKLAAQFIQLLAHHRFQADEDYLKLLIGFKPDQHLTTDHARRTDPSLLPWAPPRFHLLSCFCMSFTYRK